LGVEGISIGEDFYDKKDMIIEFSPITKGDKDNESSMDVEAVSVGEDFYDKKDMVDFSPVIEKRSVEFGSVGNRKSLRLRKKMNKVFGSLRGKKGVPRFQALGGLPAPEEDGDFIHGK
jgi:hypothetical protein